MNLIAFINARTVVRDATLSRKFRVRLWWREDRIVSDLGEPLAQDRGRVYVVSVLLELAWTFFYNFRRWEGPALLALYLHSNVDTRSSAYSIIDSAAPLIRYSAPKICTQVYRPPTHEIGFSLSRFLSIPCTYFDLLLFPRSFSVVGPTGLIDCGFFSFIIKTFLLLLFKWLLLLKFHCFIKSYKSYEASV